jgi:hypothetical protein
MSSLEQRQTEFAESFGLTLEHYKKLASALNHTELVTCLELLRAKRHRSGFRSHCKSQIQQWLGGAPYLKPLSQRQFEMAMPKWPIHYTIPT